jgi:hypothetical protein
MICYPRIIDMLENGLDKYFEKNPNHPMREVYDREMADNVQAQLDANNPEKRKAARSANKQAPENKPEEEEKIETPTFEGVESPYGKIAAEQKRLRETRSKRIKDMTVDEVKAHPITSEDVRLVLHYRGLQRAIEKLKNGYEVALKKYEQMKAEIEKDGNTPTNKQKEELAEAKTVAQAWFNKLNEFCEKLDAFNKEEVGNTTKGAVVEEALAKVQFALIQPENGLGGNFPQITPMALQQYREYCTAPEAKAKEFKRQNVGTVSLEDGMPNSSRTKFDEINETEDRVLASRLGAFCEAEKGTGRATNDPLNLTGRKYAPRLDIGKLELMILIEQEARQILREHSNERENRGESR